MKPKILLTKIVLALIFTLTAACGIIGVVQYKRTSGFSEFFLEI